MAFNLTRTLINSHLVSGHSITLHHDLSQRQIKILMTGGAINWHDDRETGRVAPNTAQTPASAAGIEPKTQGGHQ